jgi:hypothetical protein
LRQKGDILEYSLDGNEGENIRLKTRLPQPDRIPFGCMAADRNEFFETDYEQ